MYFVEQEHKAGAAVIVEQMKQNQKTRMLARERIAQEGRFVSDVKVESFFVAGTNCYHKITTDGSGFYTKFSHWNEY